jgi:glutathione S-transferase
MKLYSFDLSPYAARARISIYAKKLPIEILAPPGGTRTPEFLALNPMGRAPVLLLDDGVAIPESETIVEYLEDAFPEPALRPHGAEAAARVRLIARVAEIYVKGPLFALFAQLDPNGGRDGATVEAGLAKLSEGISNLERLMPEGQYAAGDRFTTADCELTPVCFFLNVVLGGLGRLDLLTSHPRLSAYIASSKKDPVLAKVLGEMAEGLKAFRRAQEAAA